MKKEFKLLTTLCFVLFATLLHAAPELRAGAVALALGVGLGLGFGLG